jgi:DNA-binding NarL/FixJ family response regulator
MRILIIEDEIIIARFIEQQLKANFNCEVTIALNHREVKRAISSFIPHLILCDINLHEENDGINLIQELQKEYAFGVIYITSYQSKSIIERALTTRPLNYIIKPVDESNIFAGIKLVESAISSHTTFGMRKLMKPIFNDIESKIIYLILQKKNTKEIATLLFLSPYTIKNYRHRICRKLNLKDENNALLKWALQNEDLID